MESIRIRSHHQDGFILRAIERGNLSGPAPLVVLVHGMMESAEAWAPMADALVQRLGVRCVTLELPWNGRQGGLWGQIRGPVEWLQCAVDAFDLQPDAWVAHSFGASTLIAAMSRSEREVQAPAVLISPFYKACHAELTWPLFERYVAGFTGFVELGIRTHLAPRVVPPAVLERMTRSARDGFGSYVWMQFWQLLSAMPFLPVERLRQPVLTLTGADDFSTPLPDVQALNAKLGRAELEAYPGAGHFLLASRSSAVIDATWRFIGRHCRPESAARRQRPHPNPHPHPHPQFELSPA